MQISLQNISKQYDYTPILKDISANLKQNSKIAIVGKNGAGKSTLLKILAGSCEFDSGERILSGNLDIKMLEQKPYFAPGISVKMAISESLKEITKAKTRFLEIAEILQKEPSNAALLAESAALSAFIESHNAWDLDSKIRQIMETFELSAFADRMVNLLSGGEQRRVGLACLLLFKPDILLLDEPTNHLDVEMVSFLEEYLLRGDFTLCFISHDRYFIDRVASEVWEVEDCSLRRFYGGYNAYLSGKAQILASLQKEHETLLKHLKAEEEWLHRGVRARVKRNEGRKERIMKMRELAKKNPSIIRKMSLQLRREQKNFNQKDGQNRQKMLFECKNLSIKVSSNSGERELLCDFSARILARDKIAIVGKNGAGKSTLLKALLKREEVNFSGQILRADELKIGYFDQHREMLDDNKNLIETFCPFGGDRVEITDSSGVLRSMHIYGYLKNFLFPREFLDKKIGVLSGGEKNRVALALLFTREYDCLILDEPTNDLDIPTINILEEALANFGGAVIFVSHDRYFVDKIATRLWAFENAKIIECAESFSEYLEIQSELKEYENIEKDSMKNAAKSVDSIESDIESKSANAAPKRKKLTYNDQRKLDLLPEQIENLENEIKAIESRLYGDCSAMSAAELTQISNELEAKKELCDKLSTEYLELLELVD